jgi:hypothetical protein
MSRRSSVSSTVENEEFDILPPRSPTYASPISGTAPVPSPFSAGSRDSRHTLKRPPVTPLPGPGRSVSFGTTHGKGHGRSSGYGKTPSDRFRSVVRRVIAMNRSASFLSNGRHHPMNRVGAEPGVDVRRQSVDALYGGIQQDCVVEVLDYSSVRSSFGRMTNREFVGFMEDKASEKERWAKVRWINVSGVSWDVVKALAVKYGTTFFLFVVPLLVP